MDIRNKTIYGLFFEKHGDDYNYREYEAVIQNDHEYFFRATKLGMNPFLIVLIADFLRKVERAFL